MKQKAFVRGIQYARLIILKQEMGNFQRFREV